MDEHLHQRKQQRTLNYLAHIHLSGDEIEVALGNFMGDGVKGRDLSAYPRAIQVGLRLHRVIDSFTDSSEANRPIRDFLRPHFSRWAGIVADMYYDHFLALQWGEYEEDFLEERLMWFYNESEAHLEWMPSGQYEFYEASKRGLWLKNYAQFDGMARSFNGMARRIPKATVLDVAADFLIANHDRLGKCFAEFYPQLQKHAADELTKLWTSV